MASRQTLALNFSTGLNVNFIDIVNSNHNLIKFCYLRHIPCCGFIAICIIHVFIAWEVT